MGVQLVTIRETVGENAEEFIEGVHDRLVDVYDATADFFYARIGQHAYDINYSADGVLNTVQSYHPPEHGQPQEEYLDEIRDVMRYRVQELQEYCDGGVKTRDAMFRFQLDESAYFFENAGALFGGVNLWFLALKDGFQPVSPDLIQLGIGAPMLFTSPAGLNNWDKIRKFQDEHEDQQKYYEEALSRVRTEGVDALEENVTHKFHLPVIGTRHMDYTVEEGIYYDETRLSEEPDRPAESIHAAAEGYKDFLE